MNVHPFEVAYIVSEQPDKNEVIEAGGGYHPRGE